MKRENVVKDCNVKIDPCFFSLIKIISFLWKLLNWMHFYQNASLCIWGTWERRLLFGQPCQLSQLINPLTIGPITAITWQTGAFPVITAFLGILWPKDLFLTLNWKNTIHHGSRQDYWWCSISLQELHHTGRFFKVQHIQ